MSKPEEYNKDELEAPEWLNHKFLAQVLSEYHCDPEVRVENVKISPASLKGDHYASIMFRANIKYVMKNNEIKERSLIVKTSPEMETTKGELLGAVPLFDTEIAIYNSVLPRFEKILRDAGDDTIIAPECIYSCLEPRKVIIFEDISPLNYVILRDRGPSIEELKVAYKKLAKFHAVSYKLNLEEMGTFERFKTCVYETEFFSDKVIDAAKKNFFEVLNSIPELQEYIPYFNIDFRNSLQKYTTEYFENRNDSTLYCLCHGDFHLRNMMFRESPLDVKLLDFQVCYMAPTALDLLYSFITLLTPEQRIKNRDELTLYYFTQFVDTLKIIQYKGKLPEYANLQEQLLKYNHHELFMMVMFLPALYAIMDGNLDIELLFTNEDYKRSIYWNANYINELKTLLPHYKKIGYLAK